MQMIDLNDPLENDIFFLQSREKNKCNLIKLILITLHNNENKFFNFLEYVLCITAAVCCYCLQFYKSWITNITLIFIKGAGIIRKAFIFHLWLSAKLHYSLAKSTSCVRAQSVTVQASSLGRIWEGNKKSKREKEVSIIET